MKYLLPILCFFVLLSCKNDDNSESNGEVTLLATWKLIDWYDLEARDINGDGTASTNLFDQWNGCKKQSLLTLLEQGESNFIYTGQPDNDRCRPGMQTFDSFGLEPWELTNNGMELQLIGDDYFDTYRITELTSDKLVLEGAGFMTCCDESISYFTGGYLVFEKFLE